ncbi:MAG: alginate export family protein [Leptospiraceae bacterium]|nr:alginate export family protein [Leptospiraceae bacterium]
MIARLWILCLLAGVLPIAAQRLDPNAKKRPEAGDEKVKLKKPNEEAVAPPPAVPNADSVADPARDELLPARRLKNDGDKEVDDQPFAAPQIEKRENVFGDKKEKDAIMKRMEYQIGFIAEGAGFNNTDLRQLDESTVATIQNTDDKQTLAFSRFYINLYFPLTDDLYFRFDIFKNGFWGHDQLAGASSNNSSSSTPVGADPFNFGELHLHYIIFKNQRNDFSVKIGRQFFEIGGEVYDYFLKDYLDAVTFTYANSTIGGFRIMAFDAFQLGADPTTHANYVRFFSHDSQRVRFFDGDVNVLRAGFVYDSRNLLNWKGPLSGTMLQNKLYAFGARYGAVSRGGSDRSNLGASGNFADNDYNFMFGTRMLFNVPKSRYILKTWADFAVSTGIDRRLPTAANESQDVDTNGYGFGGGAGIEFPRVVSVLDIDLNADGFYASGSKYDQYGTQTSHGFTSFKGSRVGGLIMSRFYGVRPTSYTDSAGFSDYPHDYERKSATAFGHVGFGTTLWQKLRFGLDYWLAVDTGYSALYEQARANGTTSSITSTVQKAQDRLGKLLGQEIDFSADLAVNKYWSLYFKVGIFLPGAFYATPGIVTDTPYGTDNAMGVQLGSKLVF